MSKKEYKFNPETLTYEEIREPRRLRLYRYFRKGIVFFLAVCILNLLFSFISHTPKMNRIEREREDLLRSYEMLGEKIGVVSMKLDELRQRDNNVYRSFFGADSLSIDGIYSPYPDERYASLDAGPNSRVVTESWKKLDEVTRRLYLQSKSLDQLQVLSKDKELMATAIPAIWPIDIKNLKNDIGSYGRRLHPIYKVYKMHDGIDLGANTGDPVYATGNAVVKSVSNGLRKTGYGRQIVLDHGFGYQTRYAHLSSIDVQPGQTIHRGEPIGKVGNTGGSTGPHLHYEVIYMGKTVDPINYFRRDMDEAEFERIIQNARETTYESD